MCSWAKIQNLIKVCCTLILIWYSRVFIIIFSLVWFAKQSEEIVRRCIMPPLKPKLNDPPFECKPSLKPAAAFLAENVQRYVNEICQKVK